MTKKRFVINNGMTLDSKIEKYNLSCVVDNENKTFYFIVDDLANVESFVERLNELHEENERLKQSQARALRELIIYRKVAGCNNCRYQNYDWFEDGDEFEICEKGNGNQQIAYHICKEWEEL